ncbi:SPOR domain-containing protein [Cellulomonas hominis]
MPDEYYYNIATGQVEQGKVSDWANRLGPYATREEAQHALEKARARSQAWEDEERTERS